MCGTAVRSFDICRTLAVSGMARRRRSKDWALVFEAPVANKSAIGYRLLAIGRMS
jgi:hypothetical protein